MVIYSELKVNESSICRSRANLDRKLAELTRRNGYEITQTNGQRVYAPSAAMGKVQPAGKGCEVFIGKLHKNIFEDELIPLFEKIGPLYKFRLMLDFMEKTRGYAFATYFTPEDATKAVALLNNHAIRPNCTIGVYKSVDNCRLFIGCVPSDKTKREVLEMLRVYVSGVVDVIMYPHCDNPRLNRGFVFVEFENHRSAAMARRQLTPDNLVAWGQTLYVDWADPVPDIDPQVMAKVSVLYLRNLPVDYTSEEIQKCVVGIVGMRIVKKVHKIVNFGFVHFVSHRAAEFAMQKLSNLVISNYQIGVEWARPRRYSKKNRLTNPPENFCTSVPPNIRRLVHQMKNLNGTNDGASTSDGASSSNGSSSKDRDGGSPKGGHIRARSHSVLNTKPSSRTDSSSSLMSSFLDSTNSSRRDDSTDTDQPITEYRHFTGQRIFNNFRTLF